MLITPTPSPKCSPRPTNSATHIHRGHGGVSRGIGTDLSQWSGPRAAARFAVLTRWPGLTIQPDAPLNRAFSIDGRICIA
jgi:hypothetical protein